MRRRVLAAALMLAGAAWLPAQKDRGKKDKDKPPDLELLDFKVRREDKTISVEGRVRNISAKPMKGAILFFEFLESDQKMISRMIAEVTKDAIPPGEDASFETQTKDQSRAVSVRLDVEDRDGRYFKLDKPGPHDIE
jgi:hypothetical protein